MRDGFCTRLGWGGLLAIALATGCSNAPSPVPEMSEDVPKDGPAAPVSTAESAEPITSDLLRDRLELAIEHVRSRQLQTTNSFWTVFHGILGLGPNVELVDPVSGNRVAALKYLFGGQFPYGQIRGANFVPTADGLDVSIGPVHVGQGHQDQFVAEITEWGVRSDTPVIVFGKPYTVMDFVKESMARAKIGQELSWTVVAVATHVGTDAKWTNRFGESLTFEDILRSELDAPIETAACGGTHRLYGLTWSYFTHLREGGDVNVGIWKEIKEKLDKYVEQAKREQNPDGSFSSNYFVSPGFTDNNQDRLGTSGHILEWLATYLPEEELQQDWLQQAAMAVSMTVLDSKAMPIESGALYHATHGLVTYRHRAYSTAGNKENVEEADEAPAEGDPKLSNKEQASPQQTLK